MASMHYKDSLRPDEQTFKAVYELGFDTWNQLYKAALEDRSLSYEQLSFESLIANHPQVPAGARVDNTGLLTARTLWSPGGSCGLPPFEHDFWMNTVVSKATTISFVKDPAHWLKEYFGHNSHHVAVLLLAWAYVFSARWAVLIPGMTSPAYTKNKAAWLSLHDISESGGEENSIVQLGQVSKSAARWWAALFAPGSGWMATRTHGEDQLLSPWSIQLDLDYPLYLTKCAGGQDDADDSPPSFEMATTYIQNYCHYHDIADVNQVSFIAALLIPLANFERRSISLLHPQFNRPLPKKRSRMTAPVWNNEIYLDRLLTLSCNTVGMRAILGSVFYQPGLESNLCGAWIQGSFSRLQSVNNQNLGTLAAIFFRRCRRLGSLWLGAIITGAQTNFLRSTRELLGFNRIELHTAAWTGTIQSFIQDPVCNNSCNTETVSRADECRLLYLSQVRFKEDPPVYPFPPPGEIPLEDTGLDVRPHMHCSDHHQLRFVNIRWKLEDGNEEIQKLTETMSADFSPCTYLDHRAIPVNKEIVRSTIDYSYLNREIDLSEIVTRSVFRWMRYHDGYPLSEQSIRRHPWIDLGESSDEEEYNNNQSHISLDTMSSLKPHVRAWILNAETVRSRSI